MKISFSISILFLLIGSGLHAQEVPTKHPLTIGEVALIHSESLQEERRLNIYLPAAYDSTKSYPVIYVLDGSMHEDFVHLCGLVQFFQLQFSMPEVIVVGIANVDRQRDFTHPTELEDLKKDLPTSGYSAAFIDFIETELQPYIDQSYSTNKDRYLIGQSLGGLLATEILLKKTDLFSHYFIISPSLWWDDESMLKESEALLRDQKHGKLFVYIAVGKEEHPVMQRDAKQLFKSIQKLGDQTINLHFNHLKKENHASILHNSIYEGLQLLYHL